MGFYDTRSLPDQETGFLYHLHHLRKYHSPNYRALKYHKAFNKLILILNNYNEMLLGIFQLFWDQSKGAQLPTNQCILST